LDVLVHYIISTSPYIDDAVVTSLALCIASKTHGAALLNSALCTACQYGERRAAKILLYSKALVNERDVSGKTPLFNAALGRDEDLVRTLLEAQADVNARVVATGQTVLHAAVYQGNYTIVRLIFMKNASILDDKFGRSPLTLAVEAKEEDIVDLLKFKKKVLTKKENVEKAALDNQDLTWLQKKPYFTTQLACESVAVETRPKTDKVQPIAQTNVVDARDRSWLEPGREKSQKTLAQQLQSQGELKDGRNRSWLTETPGYSKMLKNFEEQKNEVLLDRRDRTWLQKSSLLQQKTLNLIQQSQSQEREKDGRNRAWLTENPGSKKDSRNRTWLHCRAPQKIPERILSARLETAKDNTLRNTKLNQVEFSWGENKALAKKVEAYTQGCSLGSHDASYLLHHYSAAGKLDALVQVLRANPNTNVSNDEGFTPLHFAAFTGHLPILHLLLLRMANVNHQGRDRLTPLCLAARHEHVRAVHVLLQHSADVNFEGQYRSSPLVEVVRNANMECLELLLMHGARVTEYALEEAKKRRNNGVLSRLEKNTKR